MHATHTVASLSASSATSWSRRHGATHKMHNMPARCTFALGRARLTSRAPCVPQVGAATATTRGLDAVVLHTVPPRGGHRWAHERPGARACGRFAYASGDINEKTLPRVGFLAGGPPPFSLLLKAAPHRLISTAWFAAAALGAAEVPMHHRTTRGALPTPRTAPRLPLGATAEPVRRACAVLLRW